MRTFVPHQLRNVINPWQKPVDVKTQAKTAAKILAPLPKAVQDEWLGFHLPDRNWDYPEK